MTAKTTLSIDWGVNYKGISASRQGHMYVIPCIRKMECIFSQGKHFVKFWSISTWATIRILNDWEERRAPGTQTGAGTFWWLRGNVSKVKTRAAEAERAARVPQGTHVPGKRREETRWAYKGACVNLLTSWLFSYGSDPFIISIIILCNIILYCLHK